MKNIFRESGNLACMRAGRRVMCEAQQPHNTPEDRMCASQTNSRPANSPHSAESPSPPTTTIAAQSSASTLTAPTDLPPKKEGHAMNNHLADARKCVDSASQAVDAGRTDACMQIIAHLEAQQTSNTLNDKCPACRDDHRPCKCGLL